MEPWRRTFHAVWPSLFATSMGLMAFLPTLALYVGERYGIDDPQQVALWGSIVYGAAPLAAALCGPLWGTLGDRVGKKPMAIRANLAIAATTAVMPFLPTPWLLLVMRIVQGALAGYVAPAMALVSQQAPRELHGLVIARMQVAMAAGSFLGPLLGAAVADLWGRAALFWVTSVLTAWAAFRLHRSADEEPPVRPSDGASFAGAFGAGMRALLSRRIFAGLLLLVLLLRLGQNMLEPLLALFVRELGAPRWLAPLQLRPELALELTIGGAFAVLAVAQWVFTPWWGRLADRFGPLRCLAWLGLSLGAVLTATAWTAGIDQFLVLRALAACLMAGSMTLAYAAASKRVDDALRTLAFSLVQSCMQLGFGLGPQLGSLVAALGRPGVVEFRHAFVAAGMLCVLAGLGMLWLRRSPAHHDHPPRPPLPDGAAPP
ncbi:MAG: MFS transporter [Planctomycetes bacterium]|nr:MFS transporter [Planctomycetota bacterium]